MVRPVKAESEKPKEEENREVDPEHEALEEIINRKPVFEVQGSVTVQVAICAFEDLGWKLIGDCED